MVFLPMLDLSPSDMFCVYSTLHYVAVHARKLNMTQISRLTNLSSGRHYVL